MRVWCTLEEYVQREVSVFGSTAVYVVNQKLLD